MPKPPFRPRAAGTIGFFFGVVAGALVSVISLRRMGHEQKAKKVLWFTLLATAVAAGILILIPHALVRPVGLVLEVIWYFVFSEIQDREFIEWQAVHAEVKPSSGWKALGYSFAGLAAFFAIFIAIGIFLDAMGIATP